MRIPGKLMNQTRVNGKKTQFWSVWLKFGFSIIFLGFTSTGI